jgi:hypothetical protein
MRSAKFFRYIWRIDAILIFIAAAAAVFGVVMLIVSEIKSSARQREAAATAPPVVENAAKKDLRLGGLTRIEGTSVFRAELTSARHGVEFASGGGYGSETRNILFIDSADASARWLLPSDKEVITFDTAIADPASSDESKPPIATVILVKPYSDNPDGVDGRLLLLDPVARHIHEVASGVNAVDGASLTPDGQIAILFESSRTYRLALFDHSSLLKISERVVNVPQLK